MRRQWTLLGMLAALSFSCCATSTPSYAEEGASLYDWTMCIQTQRLERQFEYDRSNLRDVDRLDVDFYTKDEEEKAVEYESLWYHKGRPIGLERFNPLLIPRGQNICIRVTHKTDSPTNEETQAAGNMILRVMLDAQLNQSAIQTVKVPQRSFWTIINYLHSKGCVTAPQNQQGNVKILLHIESEPKGQTEDLNYT